MGKKNEKQAAVETATAAEATPETLENVQETPATDTPVDPERREKAEKVAALALDLGFPMDKVQKALNALLHEGRVAVYKWRGDFRAADMIGQLIDCGFRIIELENLKPVDTVPAEYARFEPVYKDDLSYLLGALQGHETVVATGLKEGNDYRLVLSTKDGRELIRVKQTSWSKTIDSKLELVAKRQAKADEKVNAKKAKVQKDVEKLASMVGAETVAELLAQYGKK